MNIKYLIKQLFLFFFLSFIFSLNISTLNAQTKMSTTSITSGTVGSMQMFMTGELDIQKDGKPLKNVEVVAFDQSVKTTEKGIAYLENIMQGKQIIRIIDANKEYDVSININNQKTVVDINTPPITISSSVKTSPTNVSFTTVILISVLLLLFLILIYAYFKKTLIFSKYNLQNLSKTNFGKFLLIGMAILVFTIVFIQVFYLNLNSNTFTNSKASTNNLPVPTNVSLTQDDKSAVFEWNNKQRIGYFADTTAYFDSSNYGYVVFWGHDDGNGGIKENPPLRKLTYDPVIQLQPLIDGDQYVAQIASVDFTGDISPFTPSIKFHSDSTRVNNLRTQMNGFFDDFNQPTGPFDELKWNNAYSGCVGAGLGGQFINSQFHAHNQIFDSNCDRGVNSSRPRSTFDYTNRTGTIVFDMDGITRRDKWYLDLNPDTYGPIDIEGHTSLDANDPNHNGLANSGPTTPIHTIRITATDNNIALSTFDDQGWQYSIDGPKGENTGNVGTLCGDTPNSGLAFCSSPLNTVKNVRRHWKITVNQNKITVFINDIPVAQTDSSFTIPFSKANLDWVFFSYNTPKSNEPTSLLHWDNFGFDAPAGFTQNTVTHNYIDGNVGTTNFQNYSSTATTPTLYKSVIKIPDAISTAISARLMITAVMRGNGHFAWSASDKIKINNKIYALPNPASIAHYANIPLSTILPQTLNIPINLSDLIQGDNSIEISPTSSGFLNVHIELDFNKNTAPTYTQPITIWPNYVYEPKSFDIGPNYIIKKIGTFDMGLYQGGKTYDLTNNVDGGINKPVSITGQNDVLFTIGNDIAMSGNSSNPGIVEYDVLLDRNVVKTIATNNYIPSPQVVGKYSIDSTTLCNGIHEISIQAFNVNGTPGIPDFFQADIIQNGAYNPIFINVNNSNQSNCTHNPIDDIKNGSFPATLLTSPMIVQSTTPGITTTVVTTPIITTNNTTTIAPTTTTMPTTTVIGTPTITTMAMTATPTTIMSTTKQQVTTTVATPTSTTNPTTTFFKRGDFNHDNQVTIQDLSILLGHLSSNSSQDLSLYDLNSDNGINIKDISILISLIGK